MVVFTGVEPIALSTQNLRSTYELKYEVSQMHDYLLFVKEYNPLKNLSFSQKYCTHIPASFLWRTVRDSNPQHRSDSPASYQL